MAEPKPEPDAIEQEQPIHDDRRPAGRSVPADVPQPDALEQAEPVREEGVGRRSSLPPDVPEADALEQDLPVEGELEDEYPDPGEPPERPDYE